MRYETWRNGQLVSFNEIAPTLTDLNREQIQTKARQAINGNRTFLALASPTNAQTLAQVKALTREANAVIRLLLNQLDDISDT